MSQDFHYDAEYEGKRFDLEDSTPEEAKAWLDNWWDEKCEDEGIRNGEVMEGDAVILKIDPEIEDEEKEIVERIPYSLSYEGYHGDYAEHNLNHRGGFL